MSSEFSVTTQRTQTFRAGWGVSVVAVWSGDEDEGPERVADIDVSVVEIREDAVQIIGGAPCIQIAANMYVPIENFRELPELSEDDTHDLRDRWFATEQEARAHAANVQRTWDHPPVWVSFVRLD